jgi:hypothetical protein
MASPSQNPYQTAHLQDVFKHLADYAQTRMADFEKLSAPDYARAMQEVRNVVADAYGQYGQAGTLTYAEMQRYNRIGKLKSEIEYAIKNNLREVAPKAQKILTDTANYSYNGSANIAAQLTTIKLPKLSAQEVSDIINKSPGIGPGMSFIDRMRLRQSDTIVRMQKDVMRQLMKPDGAPLEDTWASIQSSMEKTYLRDIAALKDEAHHVSQSAIDASVKYGTDAGLKPVKIWMTAGDEKVRPAHAALDGQVRDANEPFTVGEDTTFASGSGTEWDGYQAMAPMEFGEPALDYNCRCWIVADWRDSGEESVDPDIRVEAATRHADAVDRSDSIMNLFNKIVGDYGGDINGDYNLTNYRTKSEPSIAEKISRKMDMANRYNEPMTVQEAADSIKDYSRFTAEFPPDIYTEGYYMTYDSLLKEGWEPVDVENKWLSNPEYHGINTQWKLPDGNYVEVQFHTPEGSNYMQGTGHKLYEAYRTSDDLYTKWSLWSQMVDNWESIDQPPGIDEIPDYKGGA